MINRYVLTHMIINYILGMKPMKETWKDKTIKKFKLLRYKHGYLKYPLLACTVFVTLIYNIEHYFLDNTKRFSSIMALAFFFVASSSFSFHAADADEMYEAESSWSEIQENYEYVPTRFNISETEILDDDDVLVGYDNAELDGDSSEAEQYSLDDIMQAKKQNSVTQTFEDENLKKTFSKNDWKLVLVNKQHPVPDDYTFTQATITKSMKCDARIIDSLTEMMQAAKNDGIDLIVCSPYRDYNRQTVLFNRKIDYYREKGYSYLEAYKLASMTVTVPGASEHQIGLAIDFLSTKYYALDEGFGKTDAGIWLREHSAEYGFILRYPKTKEYVTGITYEPWHFRYVGKDAAKIIMENNMALEEFIDQLD